MRAPTDEAREPRADGRPGLRVLGWILAVGSVPVWIAVFAVPTLPLAPQQQVGVAAALVVVGEVMFWVGGSILGASTIARFRRRKGAAAGKTQATAKRRGEG